MKTKIMATLGPSTFSSALIEAMVKEGVSGFRINFGHGNEETWRKLAETVREISEKLNTPLALIGDLKGPQVRVGHLQAPVKLTKGSTVNVVYAAESSGDSIPVPVKELFDAAQPGDVIIVGDGNVQLRVLDAGSNEITAVALYEGEVSEGKKIVIKGKELSVPLLSDFDVKCIKFAVDMDFSHIAVSYVRSSSDLELVRDTVRTFGGNLALISKIETVRAYRNLNGIIALSDAVLVARGDLGLHFDLSEIPLIQREIVEKAQLVRKPVLVATEIMESMVDQPVPARSDVSGVYTLVEALVDAIVLTNETAVGKYPLECVRWLRKIIEVAEQNVDHGEVFKLRGKLPDESLKEKYARGLLSLAESVEGKILVYTKSNTLPPLISSLKPRVPVYIGTTCKAIARKLAIYYGLTPLLLNERESGEVDYEEGLRVLEHVLREKGLINIGDIVVEGYAKPDLHLHEVQVKRIIR
ncbi:MAG: pyruvate kinase [Desulfurococcaceae archaeon]